MVAPSFVYSVGVLTGLVYVAVILLWAVVLVPQWLKRHDRHAEHRTTLTFHRAMRALERRRVNRGVSRARHDVDVTVAGARSRVHDRVSLDSEISLIDEHLDSGIDPFKGTQTEEDLLEVRRLRAESNARQMADQRRKQVRQVLIGLSVVGLVLLVMGVLPLIIALAPAVALAAFLYMSYSKNATAKAEAARRDRRRAPEAEQEGRSAQRRSSERRSSSARGRSSQTRSTSTRAARTSSSSSRRRADAPRYATAAAGPTEDRWVEAQEVRVLSTTERERLRASKAAGGETWEPVDAPLPGYLDSARATRVPRNLDSSANGDWTSERMLEQAEALRTPGADAEYELGLDDYVDIPHDGYADDYGYGHRRAVND